MGSGDVGSGPRLLELTTDALRLYMRDPAPANEEYNSASVAERQVGAHMHAYGIGQTSALSVCVHNQAGKLRRCWP